MSQANTKKPLDREGFLKRIVTEKVQLDENSIVCIRALPASVVVAGANDAFESANLLVNSLCDENGSLLFTGENQEENKAQAMTIDHVALKKILVAIMELNGLKAQQEGEVSEPEKN